MRRKRILVLLAAVLLLTALSGCFDTLTQPERSNPADPLNPDTSSGVPPRPIGMGAVVSDRNVVLTWFVGDVSRVDHYNIYRWEVEDAANEDYELLDTSEVMSLEDESVRNGQEYRYKVSCVNSFGLEGKLSAARSVTPRPFSVAIEQGRPKTGSRSVTLTLAASGSAALMQVSNDSDMSGAAWFTYQTSYSWQLTSGDGEKMVYARFRDSEDNESEVVSDAIELDTQAVILTLAEDTGGTVQYAGDVIHISLDSGEANGTAEAGIGGAVSGITLYDDGTEGDAVSDDGVYERDYTVGYGVEVVDALVTGEFTDEVGNDAEPEQADGTVTIYEPPQPVSMHAPATLSERRIALSWSRNTDADFDAYRLYRSYTPGVDTSTERELIAEIQSASQTSHTDSGLDPDSTYYYAVYVVDDIGLMEISNEVSGTTLANVPPDPVELYSPWAPDSTSLMISWSESDAEDFRQYELVSWEQDPPNPPNTAAKHVVARLSSPGETFYTHSSLVESLVYWYQVAVVDSFGARALSDSVSGTPRVSGP